jgi:hypothetical protein
VVLAHEGILAGLERGHLEPHGLARGDDLLDSRGKHVELFRSLVLVGDDEDERRTGLDLDDVGLPAVLLEHEGHLDIGRRGRSHESDRHGQEGHHRHVSLHRGLLVGQVRLA